MIFKQGCIQKIRGHIEDNGRWKILFHHRGHLVDNAGINLQLGNLVQRVVGQSAYTLNLKHHGDRNHMSV